jgi:hypothetical protein
MTIESLYSPQFIEFVALAGDDIFATDGAWVVANNAGETRHYARRTEKGVILTEAYRGSAESFVMSSGNVLDIERYMTDVCGHRIRQARHLAPIAYATDPEDISGAVTVTNQPEKRVLLASDRPDHHVKFRGIIDYASDAIWFSWIANAPLEQLRDSYLNPDGLPLFPDLKIGFTVSGFK